MANSWLRLWHDMPNDPKWRTIARVSKQPISAVLAVYIHLLVIASNATERGRTQNVCSEDIASALDLDAEQVDAILDAMQGRVLDGDMVSGWAKRQVEREDGSAERAKRWREAQKEAKQTHPNASERKQTPDTDTDTDTDTDVGKKKKPRKARATSLPENFEPSERVKAWATEKGFSNIEPHFDAFVSYVKRKGATYVDWDEALMTAVRNDWGKTGGKAATNDPYGLRTAL